MRSPLLALVITAALATPAWAKPATERRLYSDQVDSSSFLWNDWNKFQENYHPNYVADDDPKTAWTEGVDSSGAGEWIRIRVTELPDTSKVRLRIRNGYQKSDKLFAANARAKEVVVTLQPGGHSKTFTLQDAQGWQEVVIERPAAAKLESIELKATSVYEGTKYTDLCISDVQVFATSTARENPSFEKSKRKKLLAWKSERVKAAKLFGKGGAGAELPLHPAYQLERKEVEGIDLYDDCSSDLRCQTRKSIELARKDPEFVKAWGALLPVAQQAAAADLKGFLAAQVAPLDKRPFPAIDGLEAPELYHGFEGGYGYGPFELPILGTLSSLRGESLRPLEIKSGVALADVIATTAPGCTSKKARTYAWLHRAKLAGERDGRSVLRALAIAQCGRIEVRDGWTEASQFQVLVYGDDGNLALVAGPGYVNGFTWDNQGGRLVLAGGRRISAFGSRDVLTVGSARSK
jgi:hypothetical protein